MHDATSQTDRYHEAFPTGRARYLSLQPVEIMLYIGLPGLYPLPFLLRMAQRRTWGCVPAMFISVLTLVLSSAHSAVVPHTCTNAMLDACPCALAHARAVHTGAYLCILVHAMPVLLLASAYRTLGLPVWRAGPAAPRLLLPRA